jgi:trk system potassium uptake protein TrkA
MAAKEATMRVVIVGAGDTGMNLARKLGDRPGVDIALIDADEERCKLASNELEALVLHGDATDPEILKQARLDHADVLAVLTGSDPLNTVVAMLGRRFEVAKIMVRLNGLGLRSACQSIGVYKIVTPKISAADEMLSAIYGYDRLNLSKLARKGLRLVALGADKAEGRKIADLTMPEGAHLVALVRDNEARIPHAKTALEANDELLVLVEKDADLDEVKKQLEGEPGAGS